MGVACLEATASHRKRVPSLMVGWGFEPTTETRCARMVLFSVVVVQKVSGGASADLDVVKGRAGSFRKKVHGDV